MTINHTDLIKDNKLKDLANKILAGKRINIEEGVLLFEKAELSLLGLLANEVRFRKNGLKTYFNRNLHIEPTNRCVYACKFCSYYKKKGEEGWDYSATEMLDMVRNMDDKTKEVHVVGGVHPHHDLHFYGNLFREIKQIRPDIHIKAFTAVEISYICKKSKMTIDEGLKALKEYGMDSMPGGGAEIFDEEIRQKICPHKDTAQEWLNIHQTAHKYGIPSNATILYGHIENYYHRVEHLNRLRELQDKTNGFNVFIPLKYKNKNNEMSYLDEVSIVEDIKMYAVARIFLDNFNHIKAYWPMLGKDLAQLLLNYGVDDLDGTINDSTKIYSLAGSEEQEPSLTTEKMLEMIQKAGKKAVERDSVYNIIQEF